MVRGTQQPLQALTQESQHSPDGDEPPPPAAANPDLRRRAQEAAAAAVAAADEARRLQEEAEAAERDLAWAEHAAQRTESQTQRPAAAPPAGQGQGPQPGPGHAAPVQEHPEPPEDSVSSWRPASPCPDPSWLYRRGGARGGAASVAPLHLLLSALSSSRRPHTPPLCSEGDDCHVPSHPLPPGGAASEAPALGDEAQGMQPQLPPQPGLRASAAAQHHFAFKHWQQTGRLPPAPPSPGSSVVQPLPPQEAARQAAAAAAWLDILQERQAAAVRAAAAGFDQLEGWESAEDSGGGGERGGQRGRRTAEAEDSGGGGGGGPPGQPRAPGSLLEVGQQAQAPSQASSRGAGPASPSQRRPEPSAPGQPAGAGPQAPSQQQQPDSGQGQRQGQQHAHLPPGTLGPPPAVLQAMTELDAGLLSAAAAAALAQAQQAERQQQQRARAPLEPPPQPGSTRHAAAVATPPPTALAATPASTPPAAGPASTPPGSSSQPTPDKRAREEAMLQRAKALQAMRRAAAAEAAAGLAVSAFPQPSPPGSSPGSQPLSPDDGGGPPSGLTDQQRWNIQANYWQARRRQAECRLERLVQQPGAGAAAGALANFGGQPFETPRHQRLAPPSSPPSVHTQPALRSPGAQQAAWLAWQGRLPAAPVAAAAAVTAAAGPRPPVAAAPPAPGYSTPLQGAAQQREQQGQQQWRGHAGSAPAHQEAQRLMPSPGSISPLVKRKIDFTPSPSPQAPAVAWGAAAGAALPPPPASFQQQAQQAAVAAGVHQPAQHASLFDLFGLGAPDLAPQPPPLQRPAAWQPPRAQQQQARITPEQQARMQANEAEARRKRQRRMAEQQQQQQQQQQWSVAGPMLQAPSPVQQEPNVMDASTEEFSMGRDEQEDAGSAPH